MTSSTHLLLPTSLLDKRDPERIKEIMRKKFDEWIDSQFSDFYELPRGFRKVVGIEVRRQLPVEDSAIQPTEAKRKRKEISKSKNRDVHLTVNESVGRDPMPAADASNRNVSEISKTLTRQTEVRDIDIVTEDFLRLESEKNQRDSRQNEVKRVASVSDNYIPATPVCGSFRSENSDEDAFYDSAESNCTADCTVLDKTVRTSSLNTNFYDSPTSNRTITMSGLKQYLKDQFVNVEKVDDFNELEDDVVDAAIKEIGHQYKSTARLNVVLKISKKLANTDPRAHNFRFKFKCMDEDPSVSD